jgi:hypothetical protein
VYIFTIPEQQLAYSLGFWLDTVVQLQLLESNFDNRQGEKMVFKPMLITFLNQSSTDVMGNYEDAFKQLQNVTQTLPDSLLSGTRTGPIYLHLSPTKFENDSPVFPSLEALNVETEWEHVNKLWECAFNKHPDQSDNQHHAAVVTCGHYGLSIALDFLAHFAPRLSDGDRPLLVPKSLQAY